MTQAKVKYKVLRTSYSSTLVSARRLGLVLRHAATGGSPPITPGIPAWNEWGCKRPMPIWWGGWSHEQPEVVLENEVADRPRRHGEDRRSTRRRPRSCTATRTIKYAITAEVVDESRRTIVGTGNVLVARKPFQVFAWVDRGHYRAGDTIEASFTAQTLDQKPVEGKGELTLFQITYDDKNEPVEKAVQTWKLDTDAAGPGAAADRRRPRPGQYRLSYKVTDAKKHTIEGGYVFVVRGEGFDGQRLPLQRHRADHRQARIRARRQGQAAGQHQPGTTARCCCSCGRPMASTCRRSCCG